jgi:hypothetical protein
VTHPDVLTQSQLNEAANGIDALLDVCPVCARPELRMEFKVEWQPMSRACEVYGVTPAEVRASGAVIDGFGRVKCGVPYVTCMACGMHADATADPDDLRPTERESDG